MDELISKTKLLELLNGRPVDGWLGIPAIRNLIESQEAVDAVPVVRCGKCKYWWPVNETCVRDENCKGNVCVVYAPRKHYCAWAERREE